MYENAIEVLKILEKNKYEAYIVGGFPRDLYLKRKSSDVDICTNARPKDLTKIFDDTKITNIDYGCVIVKHKGTTFAITTFRSDNKYKNFRTPESINYVDNLLEDLNRRDFIINTMCIDASGNTIDLLDAKKDLDKKIIRTVGNSDAKISEDALRILRAIRFATTLNFSIDEELKKAIIKYKDNLKTLSYTRKKEELERIFSNSNSKYGINLIKSLGLEEALDINLNIKITQSSLPIWAQINNMKYPFTKQEKQTINKINEIIHLNILDPKIIYNSGLYIVSLVAEIKEIPKKEILKIYNEMEIHDKTEIKIEPLEICEYLGITPGYALKQIIEEIENNILEKKLLNEKENIKKYLNKYKKCYNN